MGRKLVFVSLFVGLSALTASGEDGTKPAAPPAPSAPRVEVPLGAVALPVVALPTAALPAVNVAAPDAAEAGAVPPPPPEEKRPVTADEIKGKRYSVKLVSGGELVGVVRPDDPWEVRDDGGVLRAAAKSSQHRPGLRLWYVGNANGYVFVSGSDILQIKSLGALESGETHRIADSIAASGRRADNERRLLRDYDTAIEDDYLRAAIGDRIVETRTNEARERAKLYGDLLVKFPPSRWTMDSAFEIERRRRDLNIQPTPEEQEFLRSYEDWKFARQVWTALETTPAR